MSKIPTDDEKNEILLSCRYGELNEVKEFVERFGVSQIEEIRDANGNNVLHMVCGNGHRDVLDYLLPIVSSSLLTAVNASGSIPLHWATLNSHLAIVQTLVLFKDGPGSRLIDMKNSAGRSPLGEAELAGWDEGARWLVQMMTLDPEPEDKGPIVDAEDGDADGDEEAMCGPDQDIEVEIEDADGGVAKMKIST